MQASAADMHDIRDEGISLLCSQAVEPLGRSADTATPVLALKGVNDPIQQSSVAIARGLGRLGISVHTIVPHAGSAYQRRWERYVARRRASSTLFM